MSERERERIWNDLADELISYIQKKSDDPDLKGTDIGKLRRDYEDGISRDKWRTRTFGDLVDLAMACLREVEHELAREGDRPRDVMAMTAKIVVDGHFAMDVLGGRDADILSDVVYNALLDAKDEAMRFARRAEDNAKRNDRSSRDPYDDRDRDRNRDRDRDRDRDRGRRDDDRDRPSRSSSRKESSGDDGWDLIASLSDDGSLDDHGRDRNRDHRDDDDRERRVVAFDPVEDVVEHIVEAKPSFVPTSEVEGPDFSKANPYDDWVIHGERWQAAHLSEWKLTPDTDNNRDLSDILLSTIPTLYNVNTHIKYYVMDSEGVVREELEPVTDQNRHLAHQLREEDRTPEIAPPRSSRVDFNADAGLSPVTGRKEAGQSLAEQLDNINLDDIRMDAVASAESLDGIVFTGQLQMLSKEEEGSRIDLYYQRSPLVVRDIAQTELIDKVLDTTTLTAAADKLIELKDSFEKPLWEVLNKRFGENLLRTSRYQFQFNRVGHLNFAKHYGKFLGVMRDDRGNEQLSLFSRRIAGVSGSSCAHMVIEPDETPGVKTVNAIAFLDFIAMISTPVEIDALGIGTVLKAKTEGVSIESSNNSLLFKEFRRIFERIDAVIPSHIRGRLMISTADNRVLEVHPYYGEHKAYILSQVK